MDDGYGTYGCGGVDVDVDVDVGVGFVALTRVVGCTNHVPSLVYLGT